MNIEQLVYSDTNGWCKDESNLQNSADLVYVFGSKEKISEKSILNHLYNLHPKAQFIGCSTSGEISGINVTDDTVVATAIEFESSYIKSAYTNVADENDSFNAGVSIANSLDSDGLRHVFVLSEGLNINGDELVKGIVSNLPEGVNVTGGLSGDGDRFESTLVISNDRIESGIVAAIGFYGEKLKIGYASLGGWDSFGPERLITKSNSNVLYELDGKSALDIYKRYLGEYAEGLPATGLLFPLSIRKTLDDEKIVRTLLAVKEDEEALVFAGNMPEGSYAQFMKANFDRLIDGAVEAASNCVSISSLKFDPELAILISCVGRKMILKQRVEEEVEGVDDVLGGNSKLTGFYSYGEISPIVNGTKCVLHNQTMTITAFSEK